VEVREMPKVLADYGKDVFRSILVGIGVGVVAAFAWNPVTGLFVALGSIVLLLWPLYF